MAVRSRTVIWSLIILVDEVLAGRGAAWRGAAGGVAPHSPRHALARLLVPCAPLILTGPFSLSVAGMYV